MERAGISTVMIHGARDQSDRADVMRMFKKGECGILIATDVSARGIDIPDINYVINYDLPDKPENYVHRVGRTGRGVNKGDALSFCSKEEKDLLEEIQQFITKDIEVIKVTKQDYSFTVAPPKEAETIQEMIDEYENLTKKKKKKKSSKKGTKSAKKSPRNFPP
jgi:ATP-dependent RNA helicase RhlE